MFIVYCLIALAALTVVALIAGFLHNLYLKRKVERGELDKMPEVVQVDQECCGQHEICEKESLLAAVSKQIEYYNDEELDRFRGREGNQYLASEIEEFREVLYTMKDDEVAGWARSLQLRGVELPDDVKDEVFLIVGERRMS